MKEQKQKDSNSIWKIGELVLGLIGLFYFLMYPRNTLSDFLVLSTLCLLLRVGHVKIGLLKPKENSFSTADIFLGIISLLLFFVIWSYGFAKGKLTLNSALESMSITIVYLYYAFIQHYLAQRYLALRLFYATQTSTFIFNIGLRSEMLAALMTGLIFGVLHLPYPDLMLPAALGGFLYAYYFLRTGRLWMVVVSHALVASVGLFWILEENPFTELIDLFCY